jgi:hypothetical protein
MTLAMPASRTAFDGQTIHAKTDRLVGLALDSERERRQLAVGHVVAPALDDLDRAVLLEDDRPGLGVAAIGLAVGGGNGGDESIDVAHGVSP